MQLRRSILGLAAILVIASQSPSLLAATYQKVPYLIPGNGAGTMGIVFQTSAAPGSVVITWGTTPDANFATAPAPTLTNAAGFVYRTLLTGLPEGQRVYYKVTMDGLVNTGSFVAPRASDTNDLSFYVYGDTRTNVGSHNAVAQKLMADLNLAPHQRATFLMHCADYVATGTSESDWTSTFFNAASGADIRTMIANIPIVGAVGNHEGSGGGLLKKYFPYTFWPASGLYYSYDNGPVHVAVCDSETVSYTSGSAQYNWLKADLEASTAPMKIVMWHSPAYSANGGHANVTALQTSLVTLCEQNGVQVVICGDNHYYARILKNGINHITSGGGGAPLYTPVSSTSVLQKSSSAYLFVRFDVKPSLGTITGTVVNSSGATIETFNLATNAPASPITISAQPQNATVTAPATATFSVTATGPSPLTYQWKKNGANITGATSSSYTTPATSVADNGAKFMVAITSGASTKNSAEATLTVNGAPVAPTITTHPASTAVTAGQTATFSVVAAGTAPLTYQWAKGGVAIPGATSASYTTPATTIADNGSTYAVTVTNSVGNAVSNNATLTVNPAAGNLALGKAATASGTYSTYVPANAFDGVTTAPSYWAVSTSTATQWLAVNLGAPASVTKAKVVWSTTNYPKSYAIQYLNGSTWTTAWSTTAGTGGTKDITFTAKTAQQWRIYATVKNASYYTVYEFQLFN